MTPPDTRTDSAPGWAPDRSADPGPSSRLAISTLVALSIPLLFWRLGSYSVVNGDEAIYQEFALRMLESGNWFELMSGSEHRVYDTFMNAPIQYWIRGAIVTSIGPSLWAMRIHSAFFGLATVLLLYRLVAVVGGRRAAFLAALVLLTSFQYVFLHGARTGELETALCFLFVASALLFIRAIEDPGRSWWLHHICFALIFNLKIPLVLIPILAELACFALLPQARRRFKGWLGAGAAILPFALVWHIGQAIHLWGPLQQVIAEMQAQATRTSNPFGQKRGGVANLQLYLPVILFGTYPYAYAFVPAIVTGFVRLRGAVREGDVILRGRLTVLLVYPVAVLTFFTMIAKRGSWYPMPAYPFLAALLGLWLAWLWERRASDTQLAAVALVFSLSWWLIPEVANPNPFSEVAQVFPMRMTSRSLADIGPVLGIPVLAGVILLGLNVLRRGLGDRASPAIVGVLAACLIVTGIGRAIEPLEYLGHQSDVAQLRTDLDRRIAAGETLEFPVEAPAGQAWILRYYFHSDFVLRRGQNSETQKPVALLYERRQIAEEGARPPPLVFPVRSAPANPR